MMMMQPEEEKGQREGTAQQEGGEQHAHSRCLYISGVPGTGKTAVVMEVMRQARRKSRVLWEALTGQRIAWKKALHSLNLRFASSPSSGAVLYNIFEWTTWSSSRLAVIGIANTVDLPERLLPRIASRMGLHRVPFSPYTRDQIETIVAARLQACQLFAPRAIELAARKVASVSGDVRRALEICRRAVEIAEADSRAAQAADAAEATEAADEAGASATQAAVASQGHQTKKGEGEAEGCEEAGRRGGGGEDKGGGEEGKVAGRRDEMEVGEAEGSEAGRSQEAGGEGKGGKERGGRRKGGGEGLMENASASGGAGASGASGASRGSGGMNGAHATTPTRQLRPRRGVRGGEQGAGENTGGGVNGAHAATPTLPAQHSDDGSGMNGAHATTPTQQLRSRRGVGGGEHGAGEEACFKPTQNAGGGGVNGAHAATPTRELRPRRGVRGDGQGAGEEMCKKVEGGQALGEADEKAAWDGKVEGDGSTGSKGRQQPLMLQSQHGREASNGAIDGDGAKERCALLVVQIEHVEAAIREIFSSPHIMIIRRLSAVEKIFLAALSFDLHRSGAAETTFGKVQHLCLGWLQHHNSTIPATLPSSALSSLVVATSAAPPDQSEDARGRGQKCPVQQSAGKEEEASRELLVRLNVSHDALLAACARLAESHLLLAEATVLHCHQRIQLNLPREDVVHALSTDQELPWLSRHLG
ncbi:hypothetical protein CLOP_g22024 [Closterium sp. NIES-67]|nr:hypothetical protein CLOP_g22024 [Closterium sp. NIES-67]